jgi:protein-tyrosine-phosphatase
LVAVPSALEVRAERHAALGDPTRLAIVDDLTWSDRSPLELRRRLGLESNLLAHHLDVLARVGLIERHRSSGDGRRRYVRLVSGGLRGLEGVRTPPPGPAIFVCTANSARSQLAAALWHEMTGAPATSAGTRPAREVHPGALAAAQRLGLDLSGATPRALDPTLLEARLVVTVCDRAHEELTVGEAWLHWSIPDPLTMPTPKAFDRVTGELRQRIERVADAAGSAA